MSDLARGRGGRATARYPATHDSATHGATHDGALDDGSGLSTGRHAFDEDAVLTPIFHSLARGGWRSRQHDPAGSQSAARQAAFGRDPVDEFRRDPLTAPIPIQVLVPAPTRSRPDIGAHALWETTRTEQDRVEQGRHHRRREPVGSYQ